MAAAAAAASLSLCSASSSLTPKLSYSQTPSLPLSLYKPTIPFLSRALSSLSLTARKQTALLFATKATDTEAPPVAASETEIEVSVAAETAEQPKREEVFAVVMIGSRQYIVHPGRYIYVQRLKGANVNDKITLNKVLLVGTKTSTYIGYPIVPNATVEAVVEEQKLDKKVIVFKYKAKKNYRRNIGHRQPISRIRITSITGYQDSPAVTLP